MASNNINSSISNAITDLNSNSLDVLTPALCTLIRISGNVLKNPNEVKYQSIRRACSTVQNKLLPCKGAVVCLLEMGFEVSIENFTFNPSKLDVLKLMYKEFFGIVDERSIEIQERYRHDAYLTSPATVDPLTLLHHDQIYKRLQAHSAHSFTFEDATLQSKARSCIPLQELEEKASKLFKSRANTVSGKPKKCMKQLLLTQLLAWFKKDFFSWANTPKCPNCADSKVESIGGVPPTVEERRWAAGVVELYCCTNCTTNLRFPRYNHPGKLLETRKGRCGEWANCFTLVCRSVDYEARHVMDWTDHVWTEVFIPSLDRWIHCDPCENVMDKPLMYERGWNKKLSLIIAASHQEVVDVTKRYSTSERLVAARRATMFNEDWLKDVISHLNVTQKMRLSGEQRKIVESRQTSEQLELVSCSVLHQNASGDDYEGRTSGSIEWRVARGETSGGINVTDSARGNNDDDVIVNDPIMPNDKELEKRHFRLEYYCANDEYKRPLSGDEYESCWESFVTRSKHVIRKEELDWKQCYICRSSKSPNGLGKITWSVQLPEHFHVDQLKIKVNSTTFDTGKVMWLLTSEKKCDVITPGETSDYHKRYAGSKQISVRAVMSGGDGTEAWQKAQLFREKLNTSQPSLLIDFTLLELSQ